MQALIIKNNNQELRFIRNENTAVHNRFPIPLILAVDRVRHISIKYSVSVYIIVRHNIPDFIFIASMHVNIELLSCKKLFR